MPTETPKTERLLRFTFLLYRKEGLDEAEFHRHWSTVTSLNTKAKLAEHGVVNYKQYHTTSATRARCTEILPGIFTAANIVDYDGFAELTVRETDLGFLQRFHEDPHFKKVVQPDEMELFDFERSKVTMGYVEEYVVDGHVIGGEATQ